MSLYSKFCAWLSGWPESSRDGRRDADEDMMFAEQEVKLKIKPIKFMNKRQLEEYGRTELGIELDRRHSRARLLKQIKEAEEVKYGNRI